MLSPKRLPTRLSDAGRNTSRQRAKNRQHAPMSASLLHVLRMNVIFGARRQQSEKEISLDGTTVLAFQSDTVHESPHASATRCASSLPALGLCTRSHVLCLFSSGCRQTRWHDTTCITDPVTSYSRTTRNSFPLVFVSKLVVKWSQHRVQFRWFFQPQVCVCLRSAPWSTRWCL